MRDMISHEQTNINGRPNSGLQRNNLLRLMAVSALAMASVLGTTSLHAQEQDQEAAEDQDDQQASQENVIIITAQGRQQVLADVPISVSAISAESLENSGANDIRQLNQVAPSLLVSSTGNEANASARIRGIGTVGDNPGLESSVAVFIDGVYRSRSGIGMNELGEIERVEVLRGPQGTLFGRNASAGLINIISKKPEFQFGANGEFTYGNFDMYRIAGSITGPITDQLAARIDAVYVNRDGYYYDPVNDKDVNDRDRVFVRGQMLFEPTDTLSFRLIGDYTHRDESCCGAVYLDREENPLIGNLLDPAANNIVRVLIDLGQDPARFSNPYSRILSVSPGRDYAGKTEDWGVSLEANWELGFGTVTSITGYRDYSNNQGGDIDYGMVDILYRTPDSSLEGRSFETFSQELRIQGTAFNDRLDWLIGGYYADENLTTRDNLRFGNDYGRFATCRIVTGGGLNPFYDPTGGGCLSALGRGTVAGGFGADFINAFDALDSLNDLGSISDRYFQNSRNFAFFTHNIFHITDNLDLTLGLRYTDERKRFNATFSNDNTICPTVQGLVLDDLQSNPNPTARALAGALIGLSCQGNSTAELNGVSINDRRSEDEWTGTAVLSYKVTPDLMLYGSYSRGYKAGGFNLDRSALKSPIIPFALAGGAQALTGNLQFDPEIVNAYEIGAKYSSGPLSVNLSLFRQQFGNFQLNTFNGSVFIVQTVNGCNNDLGGDNQDQSSFPGAANYNPSAATTGACPADEVDYGVVSEGVEIEASLNPARNLNFNLGMTYANTHYVQNLIGDRNGSPLDQALRKLPGQDLSNAPTWVVTSSASWTPELGNTGMSMLFYIDTRTTDNFNTGSDLFPQKQQDSFTLVNARIGLRGPDRRWSIEAWAQNIFDIDYTQVAFNSPFQAGSRPQFTDPQFPGGAQIFSAFLAEPRTYGVTVRARY